MWQPLWYFHKEISKVLLNYEGYNYLQFLPFRTREEILTSDDNIHYKIEYWETQQ